MKFGIHPRAVLRLLLFVIGFLLIANVTGWAIRLGTGHAHLMGLIPLFDFDSETNIPTLYSSFALLVCSLLLLLIAIKQKAARLPWISWAGLAFIFAFLSLDEIAGIHEPLSTPIRDSLNTSGALFYAWVIPYAIAFLFLSILYLNFYLRLPSRIRLLFTLAAILFISGAIGMELLGSWRVDSVGNGNMLYCIFYTVEETLEMVGVATFIYALLSYIVVQFGEFHLTIRGSAPLPAANTPAPLGEGT